ncbi:MAG: ribbon-helix-helix domain-containing protein [Candidatus Sumerlaeota bacterium]|nr:ribbon-helix-helix domain-containing protein [Candidatus Sumerlaeota bacterium]
MPRSKVAVSLDSGTLKQVDRLVASAVFASRSQAFQEALDEKLARMKRSRLARECAKLHPAAEKAMAEEGMAGELAQWPEY